MSSSRLGFRGPSYSATATATSAASSSLSSSSSSSSSHLPSLRNPSTTNSASSTTLITTNASNSTHSANTNTNTNINTNTTSTTEPKRPPLHTGTRSTGSVATTTATVAASSSSSSSLLPKLNPRPRSTSSAHSPPDTPTQSTNSGGSGGGIGARGNGSGGSASGASGGGNRRRQRSSTRKRCAVLAVSPTNLEEAKQLFLSGAIENPRFGYRHRERAAKAFQKHSKCSFDCFKEAKRILDTVIRNYGSESVYLAQTGGRLITKDEAEQYIQYYLRATGLEGTVKYRFSPDAVAPTSMTGDTLTVRLPIQYRIGCMRGILDHEIGTHYLRRVNEKQQVWSTRRKEVGVHSCVATEEGLACLNTYLGRPVKYLWMAALHYYSCCMSQSMSFRDLFNDLAKYVDDPERRWYECVRVKRGMTRTEKSGAFCKDQAYLSGAIRLLRERNTMDFHQLYAGKISVDDLPRIKDLVRRDQVLIPYFLRDPADYIRRLTDIATQNGIDAPSV